MGGFRASGWIWGGVVLSGVAAVMGAGSAITVWGYTCIFGSAGCGSYGMAAALVTAILVVALVVLVRAAMPFGQSSARSPLTLTLFGLVLLGYGTYSLARQRLTYVADLSTLDALLLAPGSVFGSMAFVLIVAAAVCLLVGSVESAGWHRGLLVPPTGVAAGAMVLFMIGPVTIGEASRPATPAEQVQRVVVTASTLSVDPNRLTAGVVDIELDWPSYDPEASLALVGPLADEEIAALEAGDLDWRGTYLLSDRAPGTTGLLVSGPPNPEGHLARVGLRPGRYAYFTMHGRLVTTGSSTKHYLDLGPWAVFTVE